MKIKYEFADGTVSEVEVSDEIGTVIIESRRDEHNGDRREWYHNEFSLSAVDYEGVEVADTTTPEMSMLKRQEAARLYHLLDRLTPTQRRRFISYAEGLTCREIATQEGVQLKAVQDSIEGARNKLQKFV